MACRWALVVSGANVHDVKQVEAVLDTMPLLPPLPSEVYLQHFCADKAYDSKEVRSAITLRDCEDHIKSRWQEKVEKKMPGYRARRWVMRKNVFLDESVQAFTHPLGKESSKL